ncbi:hypothetical protein V8G54_016810 [Vigna mungo]|uniref:DUF7050 domain-containing protein n=1 Tax=Vigna mungo TaxID=3915 RepID=A0AAQ3NNP9_VIGMU
MDAVFALPQAPRAHFLRSLIQSFACTYVSLWQHSHLSNRLFFLDGFYNALNNKPTSSQTLFHHYRALTFDVSDECVPGLAFKNQLPYIQLKLSDLLPLTSTQIQPQFFLVINHFTNYIYFELECHLVENKLTKNGTDCLK